MSQECAITFFFETCDFMKFYEIGLKTQCRRKKNVALGR